ncbi:Mitotic spindle assembly checkpoint protein MAD1 [Camelus dromedarius]|uniref:Mitotic spindle assembly checkpoint protein MAD1 n=1 Tax=Camelus dromedarius TaxID=9838 RepID=A0A5N4EHP6_CAMDR|nr:Mitotic spindle assembly checkpoint protein MAD1 [Camelus dromedarius]
MEREKQVEPSHKRARVELERAASTGARGHQLEADHNRELLTRVQQPQEQDAAVDEKMKERVERNRLCKQSLTSKKLQENSLVEASEIISEDLRIAGEVPGV